MPEEDETAGLQRIEERIKLRAWQAWHRKEELPHWIALLRQAGVALDDGVMTADELLAWTSQRGR